MALPVRSGNARRLRKRAAMMMEAIARCQAAESASASARIGGRSQDGEAWRALLDARRAAAPSSGPERLLPRLKRLLERHLRWSRGRLPGSGSLLNRAADAQRAWRGR